MNFLPLITGVLSACWAKYAARQFALIMGNLSRTCGDQLHLQRHPLEPAGGALQSRLRKAIPRFERLLNRLALGRPSIRRARNKPRGKPATPRRPYAMPRSANWLVAALGWHVTGYGSQLEYLISRPGVAALLAKDQQAADRILNPIRRILGQMPPKPRKPRAPRPPKPPGEPMTPYGMAIADWRPTIEHPVYDGKRPWWMPTKRKRRRERAMDRIEAERERRRAEKPA